MYDLRDICLQEHHEGVLIDWTDDFDSMLNELEARAAAGDQTATVTLELIWAELEFLQELPNEPEDDTRTLRRVRQSKNHPLWRLSHPYRQGFAVRTVVWFPAIGTVVLALFANNKARMGDVFYDSVGSRADQIIDQWIRERKADQ